jgi:hypothetical protein
MKPLTGDQAMAELRKFAGVQFDPVVVDAFARTHWAAGINDPGRATEPRPPVPLLAQAASRMAAAGAAAGAVAGAEPAAMPAPTVMPHGSTPSSATGTAPDAAS